MRLRGVTLETHEIKTIRFLNSYGFGIEAIRPSSAPHSDNADLLMLGTIWEMKAPKTANPKTLKKRMAKASKQATRVIFDIRGAATKYQEAEKIAIDLFKGNRTLRRMLLITYRPDGEGRREIILDFRK